MKYLDLNELIAHSAAHTAQDISYLLKPNVVDVLICDLIAPSDVNPTAFALPFMDDGRLVLADNVKRGKEPCGGHREFVEGLFETAVETAIRESAEESGAVLKTLEPIGMFRSHTQAERPEGYRYPHPWSVQQFFTGIVDHIDLTKVLRHESNGPVFVQPEDAKAVLGEREYVLYKVALSKLFPVLAAKHELVLGAQP